MGERTIDFLVQSHSKRCTGRRQSMERKNATVIHFCAEEPMSSAPFLAHDNFYFARNISSLVKI